MAPPFFSSCGTGITADQTTDIRDLTFVCEGVLLEVSETKRTNPARGFFMSGFRSYQRPKVTCRIYHNAHAWQVLYFLASVDIPAHACYNVDIMANVTQVSLSTPHGHRMTTWVDAHPKLIAGNKLELKKDDRLWTIDAVYDTRDRSETDNRGWDNNNYDKHTGLWS